MRQIAAVILAAGASTRFGGPKQLLDWNGTPLLAHVADIALAAGLHPVIAVLGCQAEAAGATLDTRPVQAVMNWRWERGLSTSVETGLTALPPETRAAVFLQCDQPLITPDLVQNLVDCFEKTEALIVHPTCAGQRSTPVLFSHRLFPELAAIRGDEGGRSLIDRHAKDVATVEIADPDMLADIDTPADYAKARRFKSTRGRDAASLETRPTSKGEPHAPPASIWDKLERSHLIIDMDGVLWHGDKPMDGLQDFFAALRQHRLTFVLATNNSSRLPEQYVAKLARFGVEVPAERILTSSQAAATYLANLAPPGTRVYAIGEDGVRGALKQQGFVLTDDGAEHVVVGWDRQLTWNKLTTAALLIHAGASFIGTNPDTSYPTERGPAPGNGAQLAALETTTGVAPVVVGKPEPWMYEEAMRRMGSRPETTIVIGDRIDTDIAGGIRAGLTTILVLSGLANEADLAASAIKPDLVCTDIGELTQALRDM